MGRYAVSMNRPDPLRNEEGFVLVAAMMVLLILVVIGISATSTSILEMRIAGNDRVAKMLFYQADGSTQIASELLEQNIACAAGFANPTVGSIQVNTLDFWSNTGIPDPLDHVKNLLPPAPSDTQRDFYWNTSNDGGHTNVTLAGHPVPGKGGALQQEAGYEGKGKGAAQGTVARDYKMITQHYGLDNKETMLLIQWRHAIGSGGDCLY